MNTKGPPGLAVPGTAGRRRSRRTERSRRSVRGLSLVETIVSVAILAVGALTAASVLGTSMKLDAINRENAAAFAAARAQIESVRATPFAQILDTYDDDPANDPGGPGNAPGDRVTQATLGDLAGQLSGATASVAITLAKLGGKADGASRVLLPLGAGGALREDLVAPELGLPADLNGDGVIDGADHRADAIVLPVGVRVTWTGRSGARSIVLSTMVHE